MVAYTYEGPDTASKEFLAILASKVDEYTALAGRLAAADGDRDKAIQSWIETSELPQAVKFREQIAALTAKLNDLAEKSVKEETLSEEDKAKLETELGIKGKDVKDSIAAIASVSTAFNKDPEGVKKALDEIGNPVRSNRGRSAGFSGSALPRASVNLVVNGGNLENAAYPSFSALATALSLEVVDVQKAYAKANNVALEAISTVKEKSEFKLEVPGAVLKDGSSTPTVYTVTTTPKARKPRSDSKNGPVTTSTTSEAPETVEEAAQADAENQTSGE